MSPNFATATNYTPEVPFIDLFKLVYAWTTSGTAFETNEEAYLQLDANGYPTTLQASSADPHNPQVFTFVQTNVLTGLTPANAGTGTYYRPGKYIVLYDGQGTLNYGGDALHALVSHSPGTTSTWRDVLNVTNPSATGIYLQIMATDPKGTGDYIRNIHLIYSTEEAAFNSGQLFRPGFLTTIQNFRAIRFMDWLDINNSTQSSWSKRPHLSDGYWGGPLGTPIEAAILLCNSIVADCWVNAPVEADNEYITQMATLVHNMLGPNQKVYIEFSNETWNGVFSQAAYATAQGLAKFPNLGDPNSGAVQTLANRNWFGMRTAQMCDIWASVWGSDFSRVHCVLGAQAASTSTADYSLECSAWTGAGNAPCANHHITDVAIAPYFTNDFPAASLTSESQTGQLNDLFSQIGADLATVSQWEKSYLADSDIVKYKLPVIAYEAGEGFSSQQSWLDENQPNVNGLGANTFLSLYNAANRDQRMGSAYTTYLTDWKNNGGGLLMQFVEISQPSQYGEWGALENYQDTIDPLTSAPPKWQALQNFITDNPCWWPGCSQ